MKIQKFNESLDDNLSLIEEFATPISDEYDVDIKSVATNLYSVHLPFSEIISESSLSEFSDKILKCEELIKRISPDGFSIFINNQDKIIELSIDFNKDNDQFLELKGYNLIISLSNLKNKIQSRYGVKIDDVEIDEDIVHIEFTSKIFSKNGEIIPGYEKMIDFLRNQKYFTNMYYDNEYSIEFEVSDKVGSIKII